MSFHGDGDGQDVGVTGARSVESLLGRPVRVRGIRLGRAVDALLDLASMRIAGLEILCGDGVLRFLPFAAARVRDRELAVGSALLLLEGDDLGFYRRRGRMLGALRGRRVTLSGRVVGALRDLEVDDDGRVTALALALPHARGPVRVAVPDGSTLALADAAAPAA
ncbi:MAG TPA: hypothetical protein VK874_06995 [Gaiellaceae bacterium]|nr:hypothetical protein [Gaiellaceae bacterium]